MDEDFVGSDTSEQDSEIEDDEEDEDEEEISKTTPLLVEIQQTFENLPVVKSVNSIIKRINSSKKAKNFHVQLKIVHIEECKFSNRLYKGVNLYLCDANRQETSTSCAQVENILNGHSEQKYLLLKKLVRVTIWETTLDVVEKKIKLLDIVKICRSGAITLYKGSVQLNCQLSAIEVVIP